MTIDAGREIAELLADFARPFAHLADHPGDAVYLARLSGWDLSAAGLNPQALATLASGFVSALAALDDQPADRELGLDTLLSVLPALAGAVDALATFGDGSPLPVGAPADLASQFVKDLLSGILVYNLGRLQPAVRSSLEALGILAYPSRAEIRLGGALIRPAEGGAYLDFDLVARLLGDPRSVLLERFGLAVGTNDDAATIAQRSFPLWAALLRDLGVKAWAGKMRFPIGLLTEPQIAALDRTLLVRFPFDGLVGGGDSSAGLSVALTLFDRPAGGVELVVSPKGSLGLSRRVGNWDLTLSAAGSVEALSITRSAVEFASGSASLDLKAGLERAHGTTPLFRIGASDGPHIELGSLAIGGNLTLSTTQARPGGSFRIAIAGLAFKGAAPRGDGFLGRTLPAEGFGTAGDLSLEWDGQGPVRFAGAAGLDLVLPMNRVIGPITLSGFRLAVRVGAEEATAAASVNISFRVGPVTALVNDIGLQLALRTVGKLGRLVPDIGFKPPHGIGLSIDASVVKGGGFIKLEPEIAQYSGVLQLAIQKTIDVKAIGILNARLPGGRPGFSLLLIITAEFPPIQLGMGFTLNGIGGLAGINRTAAVDVMRAGLRNGALDTMLFPRDPLANVPALLSTLGAVFPVAEGRYVFGPMVRIGWGSPAILTLDVAVLIELPDPVRIILLGRLKAALPDEKKPVAVIRMDALGVLDFGRKELSLDATIYDSKILTFTLSGDMALRLSWGANPGFLLSVGGFHPHFQPPAGMPTLARMALVLVDFEKDGVTARVRLDSYFAITSNTVQFGAHVQAYVKVLAVEVQGLLGFDALVHFPFAIDAQMVAAVTLSFNGALLMGAEVALNLTGPGPWHLVGEARFVFLGLPARAHIDFTSGSGSAATAELPPPADVAAQLVAALKDARNWQPVLAEALPRVARLAPAAAGAGELLMHPLAGLAVRQRVAPLGVLLARYGNAPIAGGLSRFQLQLNLANAATAPLREAFAMGQYQVLSDSDKLARPSFEEADAGLQVQVSDFGFAADAVLVVPAAVFEDRLVDPASAPPMASPMAAPRRRARALRLPKLPKVQAQAVQAYLDTRAAAELAPRTRSGKGRYAPVPSTTPI